MQGMMRVASACSMFSLPCAEKRHCSTTRPPPPMCWAMIFRGHSALLPTLRRRRTEDVDSLSWGTQTTEVCVKLNVPFDQLLRTTPPPPPTPAGHAAQRLTRMCSDVWLWCRRAHAAVHIHHIAEAACVSSLASTQLALRQVFSCCKCSPGPGPNSRSMLKSNRLHVSTAGHIILWQSSLIVRKHKWTTFHIWYDKNANVSSRNRRRLHSNTDPITRKVARAWCQLLKLCLEQPGSTKNSACQSVTASRWDLMPPWP